MTDLLTDKTAIIYGIGGGVARTFAREGVTVFLAGRTREPLERVAADVVAAGGRAEVAALDALDERAVDEHADAVAAQAGGIDVSFNLISRGDDQGTPLVGMTPDRLLRAITTGVTSAFLTARAAARHMVPQGSGVILQLTSASSRGTAPLMGGRRGDGGVPALPGGRARPVDADAIVEQIARMTMLRRAPELQQVHHVRREPVRRVRPAAHLLRQSARLGAQHLHLAASPVRN